jgi:hypothetical protein
MRCTATAFRLPIVIAVFAVVLLAVAAPARAACGIPASPCYPWAIDEGAEETVLLEIIPNNTITGAVYRVCLCPPTKGVSIVFDFKEGTRTLGTLTRGTGSAMCRDYRFETARSSTLKVRRSDTADKGLVEGCYMTY